MSSILSSISDTLFHPSGGSEKGVFGIDFSGSSIKAVQIREKDKSPVLQTYGELSLGPYADKSVGEAVDATADMLSEALTDLIREAKITSNSAGVAIPLSTSFISVIDLPPVTNRDKLEEIVPMEARKYVPAEPDEVLIDWTLVGDSSGDNQNQQALIAAIHKDAIDRYREALQGADIDIGFFEIEVFSTIRSTLDRGIDLVMLIDIGATSTKIYLVEHGVVHGSHRVDQGGEDITRSLASNLDIDFIEAEKLKHTHGLSGGNEEAETVKSVASNVLQHLFAQANEIVSSYQEEHATVVNKAVLTGGGAAIDNVSTVAQEEIELEIELADPFAKLEAPDFLEDTLREIGPEFAVAIGAALRKLQGN